ncbi:hypothetical protein BDQ17DRAFT_1435572 [Cyathus striatus]|nr:hypothetical protein BDQ17DRAFT_1435572 [Cyathus striatus]
MPLFAESKGFSFRDASFVDVGRDFHVHITTPVGERGNNIPRLPLQLPQPVSGETGKLTPEGLEPIIDKLVRDSPYSVLNWRESIVDLFKALGLDYTLASRRKAAVLMGYDGDTDNSYKLNTWLHRRVLAMLRESGGNVEGVVRYIRDVLDKKEDGSWIVI